MREEDLQYFQEKEFKRILKRYEDKMKSGESVYMDADEFTDIAEYYMTQDREEDAMQCINLAVSLHPDAVDPQVFLARQQMFHDNLDAAERICNSIIDQKDREVYFLRAEILIRRGDVTSADVLLSNRLRKLHEDKGDFIYDSAWIFVDYACYDIANKWAELLVEKFPKYPKANNLRANIRFYQTQYQDAIEILEQSLNTAPYDVELWTLLAECNSALEQFENAIEAVEYILAIDENNTKALLIKAHSLFHLGQPEAAHEIYASYLPTHPLDDVVNFLDGVCLANMGKYNEAREALERANTVGKEMSQEQLFIYLQLSFVNSKLCKPDEAFAALEKAEAICTEDDDIEFDLLRGHIYMDSGKEEEARACYSRAFLQSKHKDITLSMIGISYCENERYDVALSVFDLLVKSFPEESYTRVIPYIALCYYHSDDSVSFLRLLPKAIEADRELTQTLMEEYFPGICPEDYYHQAYYNVYHCYPEDKK